MGAGYQLAFTVTKWLAGFGIWLVYTAFSFDAAQALLTYGMPVFHVFKVRARASQARLHDCQDSRNTGQKDAETGEKLTRGKKNVHLVATLERGVDGKWRVTKVDQGEQPCSA